MGHARTHPSILLLGFLVASLACGDSTAPEGPNPTPGITSLTPSEVEAGSPELTLVVRGSDFVPSSVVRLDGAARPTTYVGGTEISATLGGADLAAPRLALVTVVNPPPGGGVSNEAALNIRAVQNPAPSITALVPNPLLLTLDSTTVQVHGSGFVESSTAMLGFESRPTTLVSTTRLDVHLAPGDVASPGARTLRVANPQPGGGSTSRLLQVNAPVPVISALGATEIPAAQGGYTLRVLGEGFFSGSEVRFTDDPRATTLVDGQTLEALLLEEDLEATGTYPVTVFNPGPGGGTSNAVPVEIVAPQPRIALLPSGGAVAGGSGFSLTVHGSGFLQSAVVSWNGEARPTQVLGGTRVVASIPAADLASPGSVSITVQNDPPAGDVSAPETFTIRALPQATVTSLVRVPLHGKDIVYSEATGRLYVSVTTADSVHGNSLARIDPMTGAVEGSVFVGSDPARLGISEDGQSVFVGLDGASAVRQVDVPSFAPGYQWSLPPSEAAGDIEVLPGQSDEVVVSRHRYGYSPSLNGVTVYDRGVPRPTSAPGHTGGSRIAVLDRPNTIYGFNNQHTGFEFFTIGIDVTGARHLDETRGLISGFYTDIESAAGRIYGTDGSIVDAEKKQRVGSIGGSIALTVDPEAGRAFLVEEASIGVYDLNTFQRIGTIPAQGWAFDHPARIIRRVVLWGTDGLALVDTDEVFILRSPILSR